MAYEFRPAVRENVPLILAFAGPSGGGKTYTALKVARGLAGGDDSKIFVIDTESGRAKHYACAPGEQPSEKTFGFQHTELHAPFRPETYAESVLAADAAGADVIVVDSMSHEWAGSGGVLDWQEEEIEAAVARAKANAEQRNWNFDEYRAREASRMSSWIKPKMGHKKMMSRFLQVRAHLIFCLRAEEKMLVTQEEQANGKKKTVIVPAADRPMTERWQPICEKSFMFEMTTSILLLPDMPGIARPVKLQEQHRHAFPSDVPLDERSGELLAAWANGGKTPEPRQETKPDSDAVLDEAKMVAAEGKVRFRDWWQNRTKKQNEPLKKHLEDLQKIANDADALMAKDQLDTDPFPEDGEGAPPADDQQAVAAE